MMAAVLPVVPAIAEAQRARRVGISGSGAGAAAAAERVAESPDLRAAGGR